MGRSARFALRAPASRVLAAHVSSTGLTRRDVLRAGAAAGALAGLEALAAPAQVLERALAAPPACGRLTDIEHVVIFINENRSFDTYYGTYRGVRGFADRTPLTLNNGRG